LSSKFENLIFDAEIAFRDSKNVPDLENAKASFLGKSGFLSLEFRNLGSLSLEEKKRVW
jgi:hypothetical protein